mgnify:CR=1 FL=1
MNNSFDQLYVLQNSFNLERSEVIDTYIYKVGLQQLQFGMAAAVNIFKSILALMLLSIANILFNALHIYNTWLVLSKVKIISISPIKN